MPDITLSPRACFGALACAALIAGAGASAGAAHATAPPTTKAGAPAAEAASPGASHAIALRARVVRPNGQIGPFRLFRTTEEVVRARAGTPTRVLPTDNRVTWLGYPHGDFFVTGPSARPSQRLVAFRTYSRTWRTGKGTRVGMTLAAARRREGVAPVPAAGCVDRAIIRFAGGTRLFIGIAGNRVALLYVGPRTGGVSPCVAP